MERRSAFEGDLVRLTAISEDDAELLNPMFSHEDVLETLIVPFPQSSEGFREWVRMQREDDTQINFRIDTLDGGTPIGACGLANLVPRSRQGMVGIWIGKPHWGDGYGTDAVRTLCHYGFRFMNLHRIWLTVLDINPAAARAYEKAGFVREGTMREDHFIRGRWTDTHLMAVLEQDFVN